MPAPRTDIDPHVEELLIPGELYVFPARRAHIRDALREQFPKVAKSTLNSAITRVLRKRRKEAAAQ